MPDLIEQLFELYNKKIKAGHFEIRDIILKEQKVLSKLNNEDILENHIIKKLSAKLHDLELHKEFNISLEEYQQIIKEKQMQEHLYMLFSDNIEVSKRAIAELLTILKSQIADINDKSTLQREQELLSLMRQMSENINKEDSAIKQYMHDMKGLKHDKRYFKGVRVISKIAGRIMLRITVRGLENIPLNGPCMIAPHHINSYFDPILFDAIIPRHTFLLMSTEPFIQSSMIAKLYRKIGRLPFKRDDSAYGTPKPGTPTQEDLYKYSSSNIETMTNILNHLRYGNAVIIFPEGDTGKFGRYIRPNDEEFIPIHSGFYDAVVEAKRIFNIDVPIIPIGINYTRGAFNTNAFSHVTVNIGAPIQVRQSPGMNQKQVKEYYMSMVFDKIKQLSTALQAIP